MSRKVSLLTAAILTTLAVTTGCDAEFDAHEVETDAPTVVATDAGEFRVELDSEAGEPVLGRNTFLLRVTVFDAYTEGEHVVHTADVDLWAHQPENTYAVPTDAEVDYLGDGWYEFAGVNLDAEGHWQLDFDISVGEIDDSVSFNIDL